MFGKEIEAPFEEVVTRDALNYVDLCHREAESQRRRRLNRALEIDRLQGRGERSVSRS